MKKDVSLPSPTIFQTDKRILYPKIIFREQLTQVLKYSYDLYQKTKYSCISSFIFPIACKRLMIARTPVSYVSCKNQTLHRLHILVYTVQSQKQKTDAMPLRFILEVFSEYPKIPME